MLKYISNMKYDIKMDQPNCVAIGDNARVEQHIPVEHSPEVQISRGDLLDLISRSNTVLRTYPNEIAGIHIERNEVDEIITWLLHGNPTERLGMVIDQPGAGKSVVMRDVLEELEASGIPVLSLKADTFSGVTTTDQLADRLGLPIGLEECARFMAKEQLFVLLADQIDALSVTLSRDQATIDLMLNVLSRLRTIESLRTLASCRTFDLNQDPRLSTIKVDRKFQLLPLQEEQVSKILHAIGVDPSTLLPDHRKLLATPLHLEVYARVVSNRAHGKPAESFHTLQELYEALWQKYIQAVQPASPPPSERVAAVYKLVDKMQNNSQLSAPLAVLDDNSEAAHYLERMSFIRREKSSWVFSHQTLFDYSYARRFVAQEKSLSREILEGEQGLFERSQMVQVLAYLRGADEVQYLRELKALLFSESLRVHLRMLLISWFGSLHKPTANEFVIARQLMTRGDGLARFLHSSSSNEDWFDLLNEDVLPLLLAEENEQSVNAAILYLNSLMQKRTSEVLKRLLPYLNKSEEWDSRIAFCLCRLENWQSEEALNLFCDLLRRGRTARQETVGFQHLAESNPAWGCLALRIYLERRFEESLGENANEEGGGENGDAKKKRSLKINHNYWDGHLVDDYAVREVMSKALEVCPEKIVEHIILWFVDIVIALTEPGRPDRYASDRLFSDGWYDQYIPESAAFAMQIADALVRVAQTDPTLFRTTATQLSPVDSLTIHRVLARAYLANANEYAGDIFEYLISDHRRLFIGEYGSWNYESCLLFSAVFQHLDQTSRIVLERLVLNLRPNWEKHVPQYSGLTQLRLLKGASIELLSGEARRKLQELERKFPDFKIEPPQGVISGFVGPPLEEAALAKMSDRNWLRSMRRYGGSLYRSPKNDPFKGGLAEHAGAFGREVKKNPERFYRLALKFDDDIPFTYVQAAFSGLAEAEAPAEWLFDLIRRFLPRIESYFRQEVCWCLQKRAGDKVPDDIFEMITDWALNDPDPAEDRELTADDKKVRRRDEAHSHGINSIRGAAVEAVCHCARKQQPPQIDRALKVLELAANDPTVAVRTCVVNQLRFLLGKEQDERVLNIFERTMDGQPYLLQSPLVQDFLYWCHGRRFARIRPFIEMLLSDDDEGARQAGARLACLSAFSNPDAVTLERLVIRGDVAMRKGAAQIYARNLHNKTTIDVCRGRLSELMHDSEEDVRGCVGVCFQHVHPEQLDSLREFIKSFMNSPSLIAGAKHLIEYLRPLAAEEHELTLDVIAHILDGAEKESTSRKVARLMLDDNLVRLPLTVYTHSLDRIIKSRAMDMFERLLLIESHTAQNALRDWDRR